MSVKFSSPLEYSDFRAGHFKETGKYHTVRENGTRDWLLIYTVNGRGRFAHPEQTLVVREGDAILLPPGSYHDYGLIDSKTPWELLWAHFLPRSDWLPYLAWPETKSGLRQVSIPQEQARRKAENALKKTASHHCSNRPNRMPFALNALEEAILWIETYSSNKRPVLRDDRLDAAIDFMIENISSPLSLTLIADEIGLSSSRFSHLFKSAMGVSPMNYIEQIRLSKACELLEFTQRPINEIATAVGFDDPFYFSKRFGKRKGESPRSYRLRFQPKNTTCKKV